MSRQYKKPPVVEALCEFRFIPSQPWDMTVPGLLYEKIREEFPVRQQQEDLSVIVHSGKSGVGPGMLAHRIQFYRPDKTALVQVGPNLLAVNSLKPYPSWNVFKPLILKNLKRYQEIAAPKGLKRIGLRYINKIDIAKDKVDFGDYFHYYPGVPLDLPQDFVAINFRVEIPYESGRDHLVMISVFPAPSQPGMTSLFLDLEYFMAKPESIPLDYSSEWIEQAHKVLEHAFEACIMDECRKLFDERS